MTEEIEPERIQLRWAGPEPVRMFALGGDECNCVHCAAPRVQAHEQQQQSGQPPDDTDHPLYPLIVS